jgi:hypothetical protein
MVDKTKKTSVSGDRRRQLTKKQKRLVAKREATATAEFPGVVGLLKMSFIFVKNNSKILSSAYIFIVATSLLLAGGITAIQNGYSSLVDRTTDNSSGVLGGFIHDFGSTIRGTVDNGSNVFIVLQIMVLIIASLVIIWLVRHLQIEKKVSLRQALYLGPAPLVPFLVIIGVILFQMLPIVIGLPIIATIIGTVFEPSFLSISLLIILSLAVATWSLRMIVGSIFALIIVSLPSVTPTAALRTASKIVKYRRVAVVWRLLFFVAFWLAITTILVSLVIWALPVLAAPSLYLLASAGVFIGYIYLYILYKELI